MTKSTRDDQATAFARTLKAALAANGVQLNHQRALDVAARIGGAANLHAAQAAISTAAMPTQAWDLAARYPLQIATLRALAAKSGLAKPMVELRSDNMLWGYDLSMREGAEMATIDSSDDAYDDLWKMLDETHGAHRDPSKNTGMDYSIEFDLPQTGPVTYLPPARHSRQK